ncbi:MAG: biotin--[acetyl-CoA-carboxylase] ligase [Candidatus Tritonobacter lacicola]|nr:biotin--[acetyl-CoA-carboxylase] ligase [Candidatus Tritonobacter lacicola]
MDRERHIKPTTLILDSLHKERERGGFVSGEELADRLGMSRAAVWQRISELRGMGYVIEAQPHHGYRLANVPDRMLGYEIERSLGTGIIGRNVICYDAVSSTNDIAAEMAEKGEPEGCAVFAECQRKGRGRMGRSWIAPTGKNILMTFILRPRMRAVNAPQVTLMSAVACAEAIRVVTGLPALIKWPNDILIGDRKVCGILVELFSELDGIRYILVGVGLNVNVRREEFPGEIVETATSLLDELGQKVSRIALARELLQKLDENYSILRESGFSSIMDKWKEMSATLGRSIRVTWPDGKKEIGSAYALDADGALLLRRETGFTARITSGDIQILGT